MDNYPFIGILVQKRGYRRRNVKLYQRYVNLKLNLYAFSSEDILWDKKRIIGLQFKKGRWKQQEFPFPRAVYNRCYSKESLTVQRLEQMIGKGCCFNSINHFNKWELAEHLAHSPLQAHLPYTGLYEEANIAQLLERHKLLYIKPLFGSKGNHVYQVEMKDTGEVYISEHSLSPVMICRTYEDIRQKLDPLLTRSPYLIQQGIPVKQYDHHYFDIRALVQKGLNGSWSVTAIICRMAFKQYFNTSMCKQVFEASTFLPKAITAARTEQALNELSELSLAFAQEAEQLYDGLGEISVDYVMDEEEKLWMIEMNGKPQKSIYTDLSQQLKNYHHLYSKPMEYAYYLTRRDLE